MPQRHTFRSEHQGGKNFALSLHAVFELHLGGVLHRFNALGGRWKILRHRGDGVERKFEVPIGLGMPDAQVAHQWQRTHVSLLQRIRNRTRHKVAFDHFIEQLLSREARNKFALNRLARHDHVERGLNADHARQALRATRAGDQAKLDFRQRDAGTGRRDAVVATKRKLKATAHSDAVNGRHNRLC